MAACNVLNIVHSYKMTPIFQLISKEKESTVVVLYHTEKSVTISDRCVLALYKHLKQEYACNYYFFFVYIPLCLISGVYCVRVQRYFERKMLFIVDTIIPMDMVHTHPPRFTYCVNLYNFS